jgi:hypothetical protein
MLPHNRRVFQHGSSRFANKAYNKMGPHDRGDNSKTLDRVPVRRTEAFSATNTRAISSVIV